jgi:hypothetical protein
MRRHLHNNTPAIAEVLVVVLGCGRRRIAEDAITLISVLFGGYRNCSEIGINQHDPTAISS